MKLFLLYTDLTTVFISPLLHTPLPSPPPSLISSGKVQDDGVGEWRERGKIGEGKGKEKDRKKEENERFVL